MFTEIDDSNFSCLAANVGGVVVPESLYIVECCQDRDNLDIVYVRAVITGVYDYVPVLKINGVDVSAGYIPEYKGIGVAEFPIVTNCSTKAIVLAYSVGSLIDNYASVASLNLDLQLFGTLGNLNFSSIIQDANVFVSSNPSAQYTLQKGLLPTPYKIYFYSVTQQLKIQYSDLGTGPCLCAINCTTPTTDDFSLTVCEDEIQEISITANSIFGDPTDVVVTFADTIGNQSMLNIHAMVNVVPASPSVLVMSDPRHVQVSMYYLSKNNALIDKLKVKYQVLRYENNVDNVQVWKDWTSEPWKTMYDRNIRSGRRYGYAVRFQGEFGELSEMSAWTEVSIE